MNINIILIKKNGLTSLPAGIQSLVADYFRKTMVFGEECFEATSSNDLGTEADFSETGDTCYKDGEVADSGYTPEKYAEGIDLVQFPNGAIEWLHTEGKNQSCIYIQNLYVSDD